MRTAPYSSALLLTVAVGSYSLASCSTNNGSNGNAAGSYGAGVGGSAVGGSGGGSTALTAGTGGTATGAAGTLGGGGTVASGGTMTTGGNGGTPATGGTGGSGGSTALTPGGSGGTGGSAGGAGGQAQGGSGTGGGAGLPGAVPSMGCGTAATDTPEMFTLHNLTVLGHARSFFVRLPAGYDNTRAYPLTIMGPGCGGSGDMSIPIQNAAGPDAIVVGLNISAEVTGRDCFMTESATSPELDYFDAMYAEVSAGYCIDTKRILYGGFSSGGWLANLLGCARSNILHVQGSSAGGLPPLPECPDPIAAIFFHDQPDNTNPLPGIEAARDRILTKNGCTGTDTMPWDPMFPDCQTYTGCPTAFPVVWCMTNNGSGHSPQDMLTAPAFWKLLMQLPPKP